MATARTLPLVTRDGPMALYEALPDGEVRGGVIVIQEAFGLNAHIESVARRLADQGYAAVAPELFHRSGGGTLAYSDLVGVRALVEKLDDAQVLCDVDTAVEHLRGRGFSGPRIGIVGFCMGGRVSFLVAARRALGAAVGFYGGAIATGRGNRPALIGEAPALQTPWLGLFGDRDAGIPVEDVERLRTALEASPVATRVVRYPEAEHGFHCDERASYHPASAADAWRRTLAWFGEHLGKE